MKIGFNIRNFRSMLRSCLVKLGLLNIVRQILGRTSKKPIFPSTLATTSLVTTDLAISGTTDAAYAARLEAERQIFAGNLNVHDLPEIYHYWSNKHWLPQHQPFGFTCPDSFFCLYLEEQLDSPQTKSPVTFVSIGAGNCDTEIRLAEMLIKRGHHQFTIECVDLNSDMLDRGKHSAKQAGVVNNLAFAQADFNKWQPKHPYAGVIANQSLHHAEDLEHLFSSIKLALGDTGIFVTSDMIGRNGHMLWPEAMNVVREYWQELPNAYRYNQQLSRHEEMYEYWDCSKWGFEGIRAQDILPLLITNFHFEAFFGFANVIDPFIGRAFGHNFDVKKEWDREFIDRVSLRDQEEMRAGRVKPTHLLAAMRSTPVALQKFIPPFTPEFCVRLVDK
jgi:SAM-dependent methyltransferase